MAKILIIDDEALMRTSLRKALKEYGECVVSEDGRKGLKEYEEAALSESPFHVLFIDVHIKGMDGIEILKEIRSREKARNVPPKLCTRVVMISTQPDKTIVQGCIDEGCNKFIVRPFVIGTIIDTMKEMGFQTLR